MDSSMFNVEIMNEPVLVYFEEHSEEIENVVIPLRSRQVAADPEEAAQDDIGMVANLVDGDQVTFSIEDAELLLNDGILARMGIPTNIKRPN